MSDVKRYPISLPSWIGIPRTDMVLASDYDALAQQLAASQKWERDHCDRAEDFAGQILDLKDQMAASQARFAKLRQAFTESQEEVVSRGKQLVASQAEVTRLRTACEKEFADVEMLSQQLAVALGLLRELTNEPFINPGRLKRMNTFLSPAEDKANG